MGQFYFNKVDEIIFDDDTFELEDKLSEVLEIAGILNIVTLHDKVDIFLELRSKNDINRNALVTIFLRSLNTIKGFPFLQQSDYYCEDGKDKSQVDINKLKERQLNGREIKTAARMANV
ncbi:hypothetical protein C2G38_2154635 [Gigaspora rosea]|uniref:Uncharacterized protein n=1 Tax=Gigaspora rosea TaxID=44941 RepID=A0A397W6Q8_9GLOM|nr:hypothetical protein C2G38_2154635 [Gigaspora rosea]